MTQQSSVVLDVTVEHEGQIHEATYYVEHGVIHARIGDRVLLAPVVGEEDVEEIVRSLLRGHLLQTARKARHVGRWQDQGSGAPQA